MPLLSALAGCASSAQQEPPPKPYVMQSPSYLTDEARYRIRNTMRTHRESMSGLINSLLVLDAESAKHFAELIAAQPPLSRDSSLPKDEQVPERVIELQKELHDKAEALMGVMQAEARVSSVVLAEKFASLAAVCVTCHSEYLYPEQ